LEYNKEGIIFTLATALHQCYHTVKNFIKHIFVFVGFFYIAWKRTYGNLYSSIPEGYQSAVYQVVFLFLLLNSCSFLILNIPFFCRG